MISEKTRERLNNLHEEENAINKEMNAVGFQIKTLQKKKAKLAKRISHNMRFRNKLILNG